MTPTAGAGSGNALIRRLPPERQRELQHYRQAIAQLLENHYGYRTMFDDGAVRLIDAQISHPLGVLNKGVRVENRTDFCASAKVDFPLLPPIRRTALIAITKADNGSEQLRAEIGINYTPGTCQRVEYDPFPEFEQARAQRRRALGKAD